MPICRANWRRWAEELARREKRLAEIPSSGYSNGFAVGTLASLARAKAVIEARAKERHARERAEYEAKMAARDAKAAQTGKKPGGRVPQPPVEGPLPSDQVNLTDEEWRIMPMAGGVRAVLQRPGSGGSRQPAGGARR